MNPFASPILYGVPPPTPTSAIPQNASAKSRVARPPIHNPYDKLTKPQFDSWVDDMTSALRRALGHDNGDTVRPHEEVDTYDDGTSEGAAEEPEDSFADIKTRREKGKGRDPREGPGLAGQHQHIELLSNEGSEEEDGYEDDEEQGSADEWTREDLEREYNFDGSGESEESSASGEREKVDERGWKDVNSNNEDVIEITSGEEDDEQERDGSFVDSEEEEYEYEGSDRDDSPDTDAMFRLRTAQFERYTAVYEGDEEDTYDGDLDASEEDVPANESSQLSDVVSPWKGAPTFQKDFYDASDRWPKDIDSSTAPLSYLSQPSIAFDERRNSEEDNSNTEEFPPRNEDEESQLPDISDPWKGPQTFAEDFYSGGDIREGDLDPNAVSPSNLTPFREARGNLTTLLTPGLLTPADSTSQTPADVVQVSPQQEAIEVDDDGVLPNSSPILSSPVDTPGEFGARDNSHSPPHTRLSGPAELGNTHKNSPTSFWPFPSGHLARDQEDLLNSDVEQSEQSDDEDQYDAEGPIPLGTSDLLVGDDLDRLDELSGAHGEAPSEAGDSTTEERIPVSEIRHESESDEILSLSPVKAPTECTVLEVETDEEPEVTDDDGVVSVVGEITGRDDGYSVEEPVTDGRLTEEPADSTLQHTTFDIRSVSPIISAPVPTERGILNVGEEAHTAAAQAEGLLSPYSAPPASILEVPMGYTRIKLLPSDLLGGDGKEILVLEADMWKYEDGYDYEPPDDDYDLYSSTCSLFVDGDSGDIVEEPVTEGRLTQEPDDEVTEHAATHGNSSRVISDNTVFETNETTGKPGDEPESRATPYHSFPMPVSANPDIPDPTSLPRTPDRSTRLTPPTLGSIPGTPQFLLSPNHTPGTPIPVSVPVPASILKVLQLQQSLAGSSTSGLFTPQNEEEASAPSVVDTAINKRGLSVVSATSQQLHEAQEVASHAPDKILGDTMVEDNAAIPSIAFTESASTDQRPSEIEASEEAAGDSIAQLADQDRQGLSSHPTIEQQRIGEIASVNKESFIDENAEDLELTYPSDSDSDSPQTTERLPDPFTVAKNNDTATSSTCEDKPKTGNERDVSSSMEQDDIGNHSSVKSNGHLTKALADAQTEHDPFKLMGTDSAVAPGAVVEDASFSAEMVDDSIADILREREVIRIESEPLSNTVEAHVTSAEANASTPPAKQDSTPSALDRQSDRDKGNTSERAIRRPKRKRNSSLAAPPLTHPTLLRYEEKRKAKEDEGTAAETCSTSSGATATAHMLLSGSRGSSRASSVVSNVASDEYTSLVQPSPTGRKHINSGHQQILPRTLFHAHGANRQRSYTTQQRQLPLLSQLSPSKSPAGSNATSNGPSQKPGPPVVSRPSNSPITRSNCRFHKMSLPKEEGGPRVSFLVPGCSLGNKQLMAEEEIQDHGDATIEDSKRMVGDIELLDFSPYLVGILRQLVGVDLLREQEVFYLPEPGEQSSRKAPRKLAAEKSALTRLSSRDSPESPSLAGPPLVDNESKRSPAPTLRQAPNSTAGSTSTSTGSLRQKVNGSEMESFSAVSHSDVEASDGAPSQAKRRKKSPSHAANPAAQATEIAPPASNGLQTSSSRMLRSRRGKRLGEDAAAYKPGQDTEDDSPDDDPSTPRSRRKKGTGKRGVKRTRTEHIEQPDVQKNIKRTRTERVVQPDVQQNIRRTRTEPGEQPGVKTKAVQSTESAPSPQQQSQRKKPRKILPRPSTQVPEVKLYGMIQSRNLDAK